jgi:hypothetical protein
MRAADHALDATANFLATHPRLALVLLIALSWGAGIADGVM